MVTTPPPIRWKRYEMPHPQREKRGWTSRRIAAARRSVKKEQDKVPLFPELASYKTVEDRIADVDQYEASLRATMRKHRADAWRRSRKALRSLPAISRIGIISYWNEAGLPADPSYLLGLIRDSRHVSAWRHLRALRIMRKIGSTTDRDKREELVRRLPK